MRIPYHIASACLALVFATFALTGCSAGQGANIIYDSGSQPTDPLTSLSFFGYKYEALNVMAIEDALHGFMDEHPDITISYDGIKSPEYFDILERRLNTGNGDDIIMVDHERVLELGSQGLLADLSELSTLDDFNSLAKSQIFANETVDYLPTSISAFGLYCNLDLLKEHGQKIPENRAELTAVCDYFVSQGITPIVANNDISLKTIVIGMGMLPCYQEDDPAVSVASFNTRPADLAEVLRPGYEMVAMMLDRGWIDRDEALKTAKTKDDLTLFAKGEQPFMLTGVWAVPRVRDLAPDLRFEVHPYPVLDDGNVLVINVDTRISVLADSPNQEAAKAFVEYLTKKDVMWEFVDSQCSFSPLEEHRLAEDEAIQSINPYLTNGRSVIGSDDNLKYPIWNITRQCIEGMLRGGSADEAVAHMKNLLTEWDNLNRR